MSVCSDFTQLITCQESQQLIHYEKHTGSTLFFQTRAGEIFLRSVCECSVGDTEA